MNSFDNVSFWASSIWKRKSHCFQISMNCQAFTWWVNKTVVYICYAFAEFNVRDVPIKQDRLKLLKSAASTAFPGRNLYQIENSIASSDCTRHCGTHRCIRFHFNKKSPRNKEKIWFHVRYRISKEASPDEQMRFLCVSRETVLDLPNPSPLRWNNGPPLLYTVKMEHFLWALLAL